MDAQQRAAAAIRALGDSQPTAKSREAIRAALDHKLEGLQSAALKVLGRWGDRDSIDALHTFLVDAYRREAGWAIQGVAIKGLLPHVGDADVGWVLDLYFGREDHLQAHQLLPLVLVLPVERARPRLIRELRSAAWMCRWSAVKAIGNMPFADKEELLCPLESDEDRRVRSSAQLLANNP